MKTALEEFENLLIKANQGDPGAQFSVAQEYVAGQIIEKNIPESVKWYVKSAEQGNTKAQFNLGRLYEEGIEINLDDEEAYKWYRQAANFEDSSAQFKLGLMCINGRGTEKDGEQAFEWFSKSAGRGDADSQVMLGNMYETGQYIKKNEQKAYEWYCKSADQCNAEAQCCLGEIHAQGKIVQQNHEIAFKWYKKSAEQGNAKAQYRLSQYYIEGRVVKMSIRLAIKWLKESSQKTDDEGYSVKSQLCLGKLYELGQKVKENKEKSLSWYAMAAGNGHCLGMIKATCLEYLSKENIQQKDLEIAELLLKTAVRGNKYEEYRINAAFQHKKESITETRNEVLEVISILQDKFLEQKSTERSLKIYHYLTLNNAKKFIKSGMLKIGKISDFNDPFELMPRIDNNINFIKNTLSNEIDDITGTLCCSRTPDSPSMWGHYSDHHKGICLGFEIPQEKIVLLTIFDAYSGKFKEKMEEAGRQKKIVAVELVYGEKRPYLNSEAGKPEIDDNCLFRLIAQKSEEWGTEREIRLLIDSQCEDITFNSDINIKMTSCITPYLKAIYLGMKCPDDRLAIRLMLEGRCLQEQNESKNCISKKAKILIERASPHKEEYRMCVPDWETSDFKLECLIGVLSQKNRNTTYSW